VASNIWRSLRRGSAARGESSRGAGGAAAGGAGPWRSCGPLRARSERASRVSKLRRHLQRERERERGGERSFCVYKEAPAFRPAPREREIERALPRVQGGTRVSPWAPRKGTSKSTPTSWALMRVSQRFILKQVVVKGYQWYSVPVIIGQQRAVVIRQVNSEAAVLTKRERDAGVR